MEDVFENVIDQDSIIAQIELFTRYPERFTSYRIIRHTFIENLYDTLMLRFDGAHTLMNKDTTINFKLRVMACITKSEGVNPHFTSKIDSIITLYDANLPGVNVYEYHPTIVRDSFKELINFTAFKITYERDYINSSVMINELYSKYKESINARE